MILLWTTSKKIGARIIRWGLGSDCSHFAVMFDEDLGERAIVFHSTSRGVGIDWLGSFLKENTIVHSLGPRIPLTLQGEEAIYRKILASNIGVKYDYKALLYWVVWGLMAKMFGTGMPSRNRWQSKKDFLCTEVAPTIIAGMGLEVPHFDFAMVAPHDLYEYLSDDINFAVGEHTWKT